MLTGKCLCQALRYEVDGSLGPIMFCHCSKCRRATGSAFFSGASVKIDALRIVAGAELIHEWENRVSCSRCGSTLFIDSKEYGLRRILIGTLDGEAGSTPIAHIFVGSKAAWDVIPNDGLERFGEHAPVDYYLPA